MATPWSRSAAWTDGEFSIAQVPVSALAREFGTPTFLLDHADLVHRSRQIVVAAQQAGREHGIATAVYYASKAFSSTAVLRWMSQEGLRVDVASLGELLTAIRAGIRGPDLGLHGNNKSVEEIDTALAHGVGRIVIDSIPEIAVVAERARHLGVSAPVMLRITTGIHAGGHEFIATAHEDQKFGLSLASGAARAAIDAVRREPGLRLVGLHSHIGSQIMAADGFAASASALLRLRRDAAVDGPLLDELDIGGGFGVDYVGDEQAPDPATVIGDLVAHVARDSAALGVEPPALSFEPGRAIVGPAMTTLYRVGTVKPVQLDSGQRLYVSVDGGMSDNLRTALYDARYTAALASRTSQADLVPARVVGKHCESGDIVVRDVLLPADIECGDLLVVPVTGAYGRSLASNYNQVPRPGVVVVGDGDPRQILRRETIDDILALDLG
ncbi:MAG: diaminopimelate decarboxylase [Beutenbergiaceae bacterium]